jgi:hypothetical protein
LLRREKVFFVRCKVVFWLNKNVVFFKDIIGIRKSPHQN